jgi:hypothetical protein
LPGSSVPDFYSQYRNPIVAAFRKKGDIVIRKNNIILAEDEQLSPTFEEIILINVLDLMDKRLLDCVRYLYQNLSGKLNMDLKNDIFVMGPKGANNLQAVEQLKCSCNIYKSQNISTLS